MLAMLVRLVKLGVILTVQLLIGQMLWSATAVAQQAPAKLALPQLNIKLENINYPAAALKNNVVGRVLVGFNITKRGRADTPIIMSSEPLGVFEDVAIDAIKQVRFTVPDDWAKVGGPEHRFEVSVLFKLNPCEPPACVAPKPHEEADDFLIIGAQASR